MSAQRSTGEPHPADSEDPWKGADLDRLYEQYGKSLEAEHWGEYLVLSPTGETLLAPTEIDALERSVDAFDSRGLIFKVGERWVFSL
jgi:hypothetical protein